MHLVLGSPSAELSYTINGVVVIALAPAEQQLVPLVRRRYLKGAPNELPYDLSPFLSMTVTSILHVK